MIEVKLILHDAIEINMVAQLQQMLEMKRTQDNARSFEVPLAADDRTAEQADMPAVDAAYAEAAADPVFVAEMVAVAEGVPVPDDVSTMRAFTQFAQKNGVEAARELLASFDVKLLKNLPLEQRAAFVARASA